MIHQYQLNGYNIVLDVASGGVHAVDEVAYDLIGLYEGHTREEALAEVLARHPEETTEDLSALYDEVTRLKEAGKLFAPDDYEKIAGSL
ncbi:MAG: thioether cross-link-forming SCIFF peptide maturase, partial [Clostridia bacterium]|nr:thioether cross-link-forming SCIFF peptide maturase [Clostridia bacterium]